MFSSEERITACQTMVNRKQNQIYCCIYKMLCRLAHMIPGFALWTLTSSTLESFASFKQCPEPAIWIAFGTGKKFMYFHINAIALALGEETSTALPTVPTHFPQLHRLWHSLCLFWQRKTGFMGCMEMLSCSNRGLRVHCRKSFRCHGAEQPPL